MTGWYTNRIQQEGGGYSNFDAALGSHSTLPEHFRLNGYTSRRISKIYHMRVPGDIHDGTSGPDHAPSWNSIFNVQSPEYQTPGVSFSIVADVISGMVAQTGQDPANWQAHRRCPGRRIPAPGCRLP